MKEKKWIIKYDEYDQMIKEFEKFEVTPFFPEEEDLRLMEQRISYNIILFACYLENILKPETTEQKYQVKALREFIKKHVDFEE